jgi:hypothetical protein
VVRKHVAGLPWLGSMCQDCCVLVIVACVRVPTLLPIEFIGSQSKNLSSHSPAPSTPPLGPRGGAEVVDTPPGLKEGRCRHKALAYHTDSHS